MRSLTLEELVDLIDEPNRSCCLRILSDHGSLFRRAPGSRSKHHSWPGGYWDHVVEVMNKGKCEYDDFIATGRMPYLPREEHFSLSDVLLVLFLHDIEKPWQHYPDEWFTESPIGQVATKAERENLRLRIMEYYGVTLHARHITALRHVEGVRDCDFSSGARLMWPLSVICHAADYISAAAGYMFPLEEADPLAGAHRASVS